MRWREIRGSVRVLLALFVLCPAFFLTAVPARGADNPVTLNANQTWTETRVIDADTVYDLNGYSISLSSDAIGSVFHVNSGATLTINDSSEGHSGKITGGRALGYDSSYGGSGESSADDSLSQGGGVFVADGGKLVLNGGSITGNRAVQGGGVFLNAGASLSVSGFASVTGNFSIGSDAADNVWLPLDASDQQSAITVSGTLDSGAVIGVTTALEVNGNRLVITSGLKDNGSHKNFVSDEGCKVTRNDDGEAVLCNAPDYVITASDKNHADGTHKYHYQDEITIAFPVSGSTFNGGEFALAYNKDALQLTKEDVAPGKGNGDMKNAETNQFNGNSDGNYAFSLKSGVSFQSGDSLVNLTFKVSKPVGADTAFSFTFKEAAKICYNTNGDAVETVTATDGSANAEPLLYGVTLTPDPSALTLNGNNGISTIENSKAVFGFPYTVQIGGYDKNNYQYEVTLKMGSATTNPTPDNNGVITIAGDDIKGDFTLTVKRSLTNFTVTVKENYVTGWTLVTVKKTDANGADPVYCYGGKPMYYVAAYGAYAYIVEGAVTEAAAKANVSLGTTAAGTIAANSYDVNNTNKVDYSDTLLTYRCYVNAHQSPATAMETYLRADVDNSKKVDTTDVSAIDSNRTQET